MPGLCRWPLAGGLLAGLLLLWPGLALAQSRVALVIGNSAYVAVGRLANPGNDAKLVAAALKADGFSLVGGGAELDLDKARFDAAVQSFGQAIAHAQVALFYYSGHGLQVDGNNYLVPVSANPTRRADLDFQMVNADLVLRQMSDSGTKLNIIILDACRNNPFNTQGLRATGGGLAEMRAPKGTLISYATQPGGVASDGNGRDSPFTLALVDAMHQPGLDVFRLFNRVGLSVQEQTGGEQQPWLSASPIQGDFSFGPTGAAPPPAPTVTATLEPPAPARESTMPEPAPAGGFRCTPQGTAVSGETDVFDWSGDTLAVRRRAGTWAWRGLGADADDPALCRHDTATGPRQLFAGWLDADAQEVTEGGKALLGLLDGQAREAQVRANSRQPGSNGLITIFTTQWHLRRHAAFPLGGKTYDALVFDLSEASSRNSHSGEGEAWYAPSLGLFVRKVWRSSNSDDVVGWTVTGVATGAAADSVQLAGEAP